MDQSASPTPLEPQAGDLVAINLIRVEGELSKYPVHTLSKKGVVDIAITKRNDKGEVTTKWQVTPNMAFGKPGPLAYKLDTIVINQKIDEADRSLPDFICLGSLYDIAKQLGRTGTRNTDVVKNALLQNAFLSIRAKIIYKTNDGGEKKLEAAFTRYSFVFTGEALPNGEEADAVYLVLNKVYKDVLNSSPRRPQDLDYIKTLTPAAHRFYHLLGPRMFATLNNPKGTHAMIAYSDYCQQAPQERYFELWKVKRQMNDVVRPHLRSGYLVGVEYESRRDDEQRPDWMMKFVPGSRARNEYYTATKDPRALRMPVPRRGRPRTGESLAKALSDLTPIPPPVKINYYWQPTEPAQSSVSESSSSVSVSNPSDIRQQTLDLTPELPIDPPLFLELTQRGIGDGKARQILQNLPSDFPVQDTLEWGDHQIAIQGEKITNPAGFQISLLEQRIIPPLGFETSRQKAARLEADNARQREIQERQAAELQEETERKERSRRRLSILTPEQHAALRAKVTAELLTNPFYADKQGTATFAGIVLGFMLRELEGPMDLLVPPDSSARF